MVKLQVLVQLMCLVTFTRVQVTRALICYYCTDDASGDTDPLRPYDANCGDYDYHGDSTYELSLNGYTCETTIWDNGLISRLLFASSSHVEGDCVYQDVGSKYTSCYCEGDLCNTNSYCSQCDYPRPTPTTTEDTPVTTTEPTEPSTELTPITTIEPTGPTTEPSDRVLQCYNCINCSS
ncbi:unnamed protein product, partial [Meganyctiphanes norvegica]